MELCLGTVQFGMDYGIFNQPKKDIGYCINCLDYATQNGINAIDTATAYGIAEQITGEFLAKRTIPRQKLFVSTKLLPNSLDDVPPENLEKEIRKKLEESLKNLHLDYVDAYMLHSAKYAFREDILHALTSVQKAGLAKKVGVSVYETDEAMACFKNEDVNFIQVPYSLLDHRMKKHGIFDKSNMGNCQVDVRTVFVKGLVKMNAEDIPPYLEKAVPVIRRLDKICKETGYSRIELAINYIKREDSVTHLVFGVRDMEQLKENIRIFNNSIPADIFDVIDKEFSGVDPEIVIPSLWKK